MQMPVVQHFKKDQFVLKVMRGYLRKRKGSVSSPFFLLFFNIPWYNWDNERGILLELNKKLPIILSIGFTIGILVMGWLTFTNKREANAQIAKAKSDLAVLQGDLKDLDKKKAPKTAVVDKELNNASDMGLMVANYQTNEVGQLDTTTEQGQEAFRKLIDKMDPIFAEGSKSARASWFKPDKDLIEQGQIPAPSFEWKFETTYSWSEGAINVLWTCRDRDTGVLYAFTTGVYNPETRQFSDVVPRLTRDGAKYIGYTVTEKPPNSDYIEIADPEAPLLSIDEMMKQQQAKERAQAEASRAQTVDPTREGGDGSASE